MAKQGIQKVGEFPFDSAVKDWLKKISVKPETKITYHKVLENFLRYLTDNEISAPQRADIISYREKLLAKGYKVSSTRLFMTVVKKFFGWLSTKGLYLNVADGVKLPQMPTGEHVRDALTLDEAKSVISSFNGQSEMTLRNKAIMSLMIICGLRTFEIVRADVGDLEKRQGKWFLKVQGKGRAGKVDSVALSSAVKKIIDEYLEVRAGGNETVPLFVSKRGQRLQTQSISRLAKKTFANVGIESARLTCHSCRHTAATLALQAGVDIREVQNLLRHRASINQQDLSADETAVQKISALLFPQEGDIIL